MRSIARSTCFSHFREQSFKIEKGGRLLDWTDGVILKHVRCCLREKDTFMKELIGNPQFGLGSFFHLSQDFCLCETTSRIRTRPSWCRAHSGWVPGRLRLEDVAAPSGAGCGVRGAEVLRRQHSRSTRVEES